MRETEASDLEPDLGSHTERRFIDVDGLQGRAPPSGDKDVWSLPQAQMDGLVP